MSELTLQCGPNKAGGLHPHTSKAIWEVLVEKARASWEHDALISFMVSQEAKFCNEYRFYGKLGSGGKFWRGPANEADRRLGLDETWRVSCYSEDRNEERDLIVDEVNTLLRAIAVEHGTSRPSEDEV